MWVTWNCFPPPPRRTIFLFGYKLPRQSKDSYISSHGVPQVVIASGRRGLIQTWLIDSASGWRAGADVLAEKNKSLLWHLEDSTTHGPQADHKEILVNTGPLLPPTIYLSFRGWRISWTSALPWALHCWALPIFNCLSWHLNHHFDDVIISASWENKSGICLAIINEIFMLHETMW